MRLSKTVVGACAVVASMAALAGCDSTTSGARPVTAPSTSSASSSVPDASGSSSVMVQPGGGMSGSAGVSVPAVPIITPTPNKDGSITYCDPATQPTPTGQAVKLFGASEVVDAYCDVVNELMVANHTSLITVRNPTVKDFNFLNQYMSGNGRAELASVLPKAINDKNETAATTLWGMALYGLYSPGLKYPADGGYFKAAAFSPASTGINSDGKLTMSLTLSGDLVMDPDGTPTSLKTYPNQHSSYEARLAVTVHLTLIPGTPATRPWLIDSWTTTADDINFSHITIIPTTPSPSTSPSSSASATK